MNGEKLGSALPWQSQGEIMPGYLAQDRIVGASWIDDVHSVTLDLDYSLAAHEVAKELGASQFSNPRSFLASMV